ncbi:MAG: hypothetical protein IJ174_03985 [Clostridia bacterium]|nr:hypothetical protein [Clostridia bacterium]
MPKSKKPVPEAVVAVIEETVKRTMQQMMAERDAMPRDCYKQTIKRIKSLPVLQERVAENKARLGKDGNLMPEKSKSIVRFSASGVRADPEEMLEAVIQTLEAHIAADEEEISIVTKALESVKNDYYYQTVVGTYIDQKTDEQLAEEMHCEESTIRRNRKRLTSIISVRLYGVFAI